MIRNNKRDPNSPSIWIDDNNQMVDCYSNLSMYGTNFGTNDKMPNNKGLSQKIVMPYPVEPVPEVIQVLGQPHPYMSGYTLHKIEETLDCVGMNCKNQVKNMAEDSIECLVKCKSTPGMLGKLECVEECVMKDPALKPLINCAKNNCLENNSCGPYQTLRKSYDVRNCY
jgi:hypothetical protein